MTTSSKSSVAAMALVAALGLGASNAAQAGHDDVDVFWSIAMSQPGIRIGVSNAPVAPVVVHERYYSPPPRVVYVPPHPVYRVHPGHHGHAYGHWKDRNGHGHWKDRHDRHDRWDDHRGGHGRGGDHHAQRGDRGGRGGPELHMGNRR